MNQPKLQAPLSLFFNFAIAVTLGFFLISVSGCPSSKAVPNLKTPGLEYQLREVKQPRPNRVHILRVDLSSKKIRPVVAIAPDPDGDGPAEASLTNPFALAADPSVLAFVNTNSWDALPDAAGNRNRNWFEGQPVNIHGLAASGGKMRSPVEAKYPSIWDDAGGRMFIADDSTTHPISEGFAGHVQRIVHEGAIIATPGGPMHPRTALGIDRAGCMMWLVVVDGRQPQYSEGMTLEELAAVMRDLGCWEATNLDGGGSSIMALAGANGKLEVKNSPSDREANKIKIRPVPVILTIRQVAN